MTEIVRRTEQLSIEEVLDGYAGFKRTSDEQYAGWCKQLYEASLKWQIEGRQGSFLDAGAQRTGLSRVTIWRDIQAGQALTRGVTPSDQRTLLAAQDCLNAGATVTEVNKAVEEHRVEMLKQSLTTGVTTRQHTVPNAERFDRVRELLGSEYRIPAPRLERDSVLYEMFLYLHQRNPQVIREFIQATSGATPIPLGEQRPEQRVIRDASPEEESA